MPTIALRSLVKGGISLFFALAISSCGDGGEGGITPPSGPKPVATVVVSPTTATIDVGGMVQFSATLLDAEGQTLSGRSITWSVSPPSVASISASGLATGSVGGEATVFATAEGRSGSVSLRVTESTAEEIIASGSVGPAGGSVGNDDIGVTISPGQLTTATEIRIASTREVIEEFARDLVTDRFVLRGLPVDQEVEVRVRLKTTAPLRDQSFLAMNVPVVESSTDSVEVRQGLLLREAVDSAGYLVATIPVRGEGTTPSGVGPDARSSGPLDNLLAGVIGGVTGVRTDTVPGGRFVIVSYGAPWSELQTKVSRAAKLMEDSHATLVAMGYSTAHRTQWPLEVRVHPMREGMYGSFAQRLPWPLDVNTGYFNLNTWAFDQSDMPGTAIHEYYHFIQAQYTRGMTSTQSAPLGWVKEAASTWIEEKAPETLGVFRNTFFQGERQNLFIGLYPGLQPRHGYGKAPLVKYAVDRWGQGQVQGMFEAFAGGTGAIAAVLQGIPEPAQVWWPDLVTRYMKGEIVSLAAEDLPPPVAAHSLTGGVQTLTYSHVLRPLSAQFSHFTPDPSQFGTGTTLTVKLPAQLYIAGFRILPFRMDAAGKWEEQGGIADSLVIKGADLRLGRQYGFFVIHTSPTAPYTQFWSNRFVTDLGYVDGDWMPKDITVTADAITYGRPDDDDDTVIEVAANITSVFTELAAGGVWKRSTSDANHYVWEATPALASGLAAMNITASSDARVRAGGDSLYLNAIFDWNPPAASGSARAPGPIQQAALGGAGLLFLLGLLFRKRRRVVAFMTVGAVGLVLWGCDPGSISFSAKFRYEFRFANPAFTASAEDPSAALVQLNGGTGTLFVDRYRSEWWRFIRDEAGVVVDSVAQVRTASGNATVSLGASLFVDGVVTSDDRVQSAFSGRARLPE